MDQSKILKNIVQAENGCWLWQKSLSSSGYGQIMEKGTYWSAHRYAYAAFKGVIPEGLIVRHTCHNRACCNPEHLDIGSHKDNWLDSASLHKEANEKKSSTWLVLGVSYPSIRKAQKATGISYASLVKFTVNGVFDVDAYRNGCYVANKQPKI